MISNPFVNAQALSKNKVIYLCEIIGGGLYSLALIGIPFLMFGIKRYQRAKRCEQYAGALYADPARSISNLAVSTGETPNEVVDNLRELSSKGLLNNCSIRVDEDRVVFPGDVIAPKKTTYSSEEMVPVICPNCNGSNKVPAGVTGECEYCGTLLKAPAIVIPASASKQVVKEEAKKKGLADVSLGEVAGAGVALLGVVKSIRK